MPKRNRNSAILLIHCPDNKGIVAQVTGFINDNNGNIIALDEHVDRLDKVFYMRIEWELEGFLIISDTLCKKENSMLDRLRLMRWGIRHDKKGNN